MCICELCIVQGPEGEKGMMGDTGMKGEVGPKVSWTVYVYTCVCIGNKVMVVFVVASKLVTVCTIFIVCTTTHIQVCVHYNRLVALIS